MNKVVWGSGLFLLVGGWVAGLGAQETAWRSSDRPAVPQDCVSHYVSRSAAPSAPTDPAPSGSVVRGQSPDGRQASGSFAAYRTPTGAPARLDSAILRTSAQEVVPVNDPVPAPGPDLPGVPLPPIGGAPVSATAPTISTIPPRQQEVRRFERGPEPSRTEGSRESAAQETRTLQRTPDVLPKPEELSAPMLPVSPALDFHPHDLPFYDPNGQRFYGRAEFLLWWLKPDKVPPLVTAGDPNLVNAVNGAGRGILGQQGTQLLFGPGDLGRNPYAGLRFALGFWCDCDHEKGFEVESFFLFNSQASFDANSNQFPVLARPVQVANLGNTENVELVALPGLTTGAVRVRAPSNLWGITPDYRCNLCCGCDGRTDFLVGFRYQELNEAVVIEENIVGSAAAPAPLTNQLIRIVDSFSARNQFYGAEIGLTGERCWGPWSLGWRAKLAVGDTHETVTIDGSTRLQSTLTGQVQNFQGGLLALSTNIGRHNRDQFSIIPELGLNVNYDLTEHVRLGLGYSFLYWSNVVRPGDQIDRSIDFTKVPSFQPLPQPLPPGFNTGPLGHPAVLFKESDFFAHGLNFTLEFRY
jgi:hypothetical protein